MKPWSTSAIVWLVCLHSKIACALLPSLGVQRSIKISRRAALQNLRGGGLGELLSDQSPSAALEADRLQQVASPVELDRAIDRAVALTTEDDIIIQWNRSPVWLFRQYHGTVLEITWKSCLSSMVVGGIIAYAIKFGTTSSVTWPMFTAPTATHPVVSRLLCLNVMWEYVLGLATFILTFFLSQAYAYWRAQLGLVRSLQGRLHDISFLVSSFAARDDEGNYTPDARKLLEDTARNVRLLHIIFWSGLDDSLSSLRTPEGIKRLVQRGVLTEREEQTLIASGARSTKRHEVVLQWILLRVLTSGGGTEGKAGNGAIAGGGGFEGSFCDTCKQLRAACGTVPDQMVERMPLAYVHIVHVLIDLLLIMAPFALYPKCGAFIVPLLGFLTLFYRGLLFLAMSFLDPFGNEVRAVAPS